MGRTAAKFVPSLLTDEQQTQKKVNYVTVSKLLDHPEADENKHVIYSR